MSLIVGIPDFIFLPTRICMKNSVVTLITHIECGTPFKIIIKYHFNKENKTISKEETN
jgi:hypothetical protein